MMPQILKSKLALSILLAGMVWVQAVWAQTVWAQDDAEESSEEVAGTGEIYFDRVDVSVVNVDVYVTDKKGKPVTGLTIDDFEVAEDRRPVKVSNFYAVEDGVPVKEPAVTPGKPDDEGDPRTAATVPEEQRLHLIIYFDNSFMKPFSRNRVIREVRKFLNTQLGAQDLAMLVTFERWLHVRQELTADRRLISDALTEIETHTGFGTHQASERQEVLRSIDLSSNEREALSHARSYAESVYHDLGNSLRGLKEIISSMAGLPGRKALLYVSDGIPMAAAQDLFHLVDTKYVGGRPAQMEASRYSAKFPLRELIAHANANRVTFYTLEAAGLEAHNSISAEHGSAGAGGSRLEVDLIYDANRQEPLQLMAADTGGLAAVNTNNLEGALGNLASDFRSYYSLGYRPVHGGDGRYHDVEVKVKRRGLKVRHRAGYRDKSPETQVNEGTLAVLMHGLGKNPLGIQLRMAKARIQESEQYLVPFEVLIPIGKLGLLPHAEIYRGNLRVSMTVIDDDGRLSPIEQTPVPIEIPEAHIAGARQQHFVYAAELLMRPGPHRVAVGVRDEVGGESSYIRHAVLIGR